MRLVLTALALLGLVSCSSSVSTPSALQVFARPAASSLKDAHFLLTESVVASDAIHTASGDGVLTLQPLAIRYSEVANPPLDGGTFEYYSVNGTDYSRLTLSRGPGPWRVNPSAWTSSNPSYWATLTHPTLLNSPILNGTPTWHVQALSPQPDGTPQTIDLWVRQSDGYPIKLSTKDADLTTFVYQFDRFNTGASVQPPR